MLLTIVMLVLVFGSGITVGAILRDRIAQKGIATKAEIAEWAIRLRGALVADEKAAKDKIEAVAKLIEGKL